MNKGFFKLTLLSLFFWSLSGIQALWAQANVIEKQTVQQFSMYEAEDLAVYSVNKSADISDYTETLKGAIALSLNKQNALHIFETKPQTLKFTVPTPEGVLTVNLFQYDFFTSAFKAYERLGDGSLKEVGYTRGAYYRGYVEGMSPSLVTFSFFEDNIVGIISTQNAGNYNLIALPGEAAGTDKYIIFNDVDIKEKEKFISLCQVDDHLQTPDQVGDAPPPPAMTNDGICRSVKVALHADYRAYTRNNYSLTATQNYLTTLMNANSTLYANDNMSLTLNEVIVNTVQDNYPNSSSPAVLNRFGNDIGTNVTSDLHQMITGARRGLGGLAWLDVLCRTPYYTGSTYFGPFSMVDNGNVSINNIAPIPVYSWDVSASSHELGHNLGSHHTHWCGWAGGAIDACATVEPDNNNNSCQNPSPAYPPTGGTIMSYCHLRSVGVNFNNGFGPQPGSLLRESIANSTCVEGVDARKILDDANATITATNYCDNGEYYVFYYDNATATSDDDEMILAIKKADVTNFDFNNSTISMTTTGGYKSGSATNITSAYKPYNTWGEANRYWTLNISGTMADSVSYKVPILRTDLSEIQSTYNVGYSRMEILTFNQTTAATNVSTAAVNNINLISYSNSGSVNTWYYTGGTPTVGDYQWVSLKTSYPTYGIRIGYGNGELAIKQLEDLGVNIFPNPTTDELNIKFNKSVAYNQLKVIDILGRTVYTFQNTDNSNQQLTIPTSNWTAGLYTLVMESEYGVFTSTVVKQ